MNAETILLTVLHIHLLLVFVFVFFSVRRLIRCTFCLYWLIVIVSVVIVAVVACCCLVAVDVTLHFCSLINVDDCQLLW